MADELEQKDTRKASVADRILKAGALVSIAHIFLRFAGLIQAKVATHYLDSDVYESLIVIAFTGVINSLFLVGQEIIGPSFLTVFMKEKEAKDEKSAWHYANVMLTFQSMILIVVVASIICFPDFYIHLFTNWDEATKPEAYRLLKTGLRVMAPALYFLSIGSTTYILLNGYKKFFLAAFGDASTKICIIIGLVIGTGIFGMDYKALLLGIVIGSVAKVLTHFAGMISKLKYLRPSFDWKNPAFRSMLMLMLPLLLGTVFAKVRDNFNNIYILTRIEQPGVLMANDIGRKLFASIQWLVPYALQIALFPFLCELVSKQDRNRLGQIISSSCRMLLSVFVPGSIMLAILAMPISILLFMGGKTGVEIAYWAGIATACYCLVLPATAIECVLMQGSFADQRTVAVTVIGLTTSFISVIISYVMIIQFHAQSLYAIIAVALGFVASKFVKSLVLALYIRRNIPMFPLKETLVFVARLIVLAVIVGAVSYGVSMFFEHICPDGIADAIEASRNGLADYVPHVSKMRIALRIVLSGFAGICAFAIGAIVMRLEEPRQMMQWALEKVKARKKNKKQKTV